VNHFAYKFVLNLPHSGLELHLVDQSKKIRKIQASCKLRVNLYIEPHEVREWNPFLL
jgi:hypothetical protein